MDETSSVGEEANSAVPNKTVLVRKPNPLARYGWGPALLEDYYRQQGARVRKRFGGMKSHSFWKLVRDTCTLPNDFGKPTPMDKPPLCGTELRISYRLCRDVVKAQEFSSQGLKRVRMNDFKSEQDVFPFFPRVVRALQKCGGRRDGIVPKRRNSGSTLFIDETINTMSLLKITRTVGELVILFVEYCMARGQTCTDTIYDEQTHPLCQEGPFREPPTAGEVSGFLYTICVEEDVPEECSIYLLFYMERLLVLHDVPFLPNTWRRILFACTLLAAKQWDELAIWNADFRTHVPLGRLLDIQELEMKTLSTLQFSVSLPGKLYTQYYFAIRTIQGICDISELTTSMALMYYKKQEGKDTGYTRRNSFVASDSHGRVVLF